MTDHSRLDATAIAAAVGSRRTAATVVIDDVLARLAVFDAIQPQAWIARFDPETLRTAARAVDARVAAAEALPLARVPFAGLPFAGKDNIDVTGIDTTAACPSFAYRPARSAAVVERQLAAGAICLGKTNLGYVSSGSAIVVVAGLAAFALGIDTAGSGRVPAAFQHLFGLKPLPVR